MDEIELRRCDATLDAAERDAAVSDFIDLVVAVDGILRAQAGTDARYFATVTGRVSPDEYAAVHDHVLRAYRWQYIFSGAENPRFLDVLISLVTKEQAERIMHALATLR